MKTHGSLFSGIGGFDLAAQWIGWENAFSCEIDDFCNRVLNHYWPNAAHYRDIRNTDFRPWRGRIDVLSGGFPCQPFSVAGKQLGTDDPRHLWPEMLRAIREIRPEWVVGENVRGIASWNGGLVFEQVCADLEAEGYSVQAFLLPAAGVNAPHRRERVWFIAYSRRFALQRRQSQQSGDGVDHGENVGGSETTDFAERLRQAGLTTDSNGSGLPKSGQARFGQFSAKSGEGLFDRPEFIGPFTSDTDRDRQSQQEGAIGEIGGRADDGGSKQNAADTDGGRKQQGNRIGTPEFSDPSHPGSSWRDFPTQPPVRRRNDGLPAGLDGITVPGLRTKSITAYGNAVVPQLVYQIFDAIETYEILYG